MVLSNECTEKKEAHQTNGFFVSFSPEMIEGIDHLRTLSPPHLTRNEWVEKKIGHILKWSKVMDK